MQIRPFDPDRRRDGLFNFERPDGAPPLEVYEQALELRRSRGLEGEELEEFWKEVFERGEATLDELYPFVVRVAWRLVRCMARTRGAIGPDEFLEDAAARVPGWAEPVALVGEGHDMRDRIVRRLAERRVPLLPPPPPEEWTNGDKDPDYYSPASDGPLMLYVETLAKVGNRLGLSNRKAGRMGIKPLVDPALVRAAMPSPNELCAYERVLVEETTRSIFERGQLETAAWLRKEHGLTEVEAGDLVRMARRATMAVTVGTDVEMNKAMMVARLEDLARRCRENLDLRAELMTYKSIAVVLGLDRLDAQGSDIDDMVDIVDEEEEETRRLEG